LEQIKGDCDWLESQGIMDYSFLLGIHKVGFEEENSGTKKCRKVRRRKNFTSAFQEWDGGIPDVSFPVDDNNTNDKTREQVKSSSNKQPKELYFVGIIDILQPWTLRKVMERKVKSFMYKDSNALSAVEPSVYSKRFQSFISSKIQ